MRGVLSSFGLVTGLFAVLLLSTCGSGHQRNEVSAIRLAGVPSFVQSTNYSCGVAALMSVLGYYGIDTPSESSLIKILGSTPDYGTVTENMRDYAIAHGLPAELKTDLTVDDLRTQLGKGQLAIVEVQAWPDGGKPAVPYEQDWIDGHDMVLDGIDSDNAYFTDPSTAGSHAFIPLPEFESRWHDVEVNDKHWTHTALFFNGMPNPPPSLIRVP